jgi:hypothetical protein
MSVGGVVGGVEGDGEEEGGSSGDGYEGGGGSVVEEEEIGLKGTRVR